MDLWGKLLGFEPPEVTVLEAQRWVTIPHTPKLERALTKRANKERWVANEEGVVEFHALIMARKDSIGSESNDAFDIDVCGIIVLTMRGQDARTTLERMRAGKSNVVAIPARARPSETGTWTLSVGLLETP